RVCPGREGRRRTDPRPPRLLESRCARPHGDPGRRRDPRPPHGEERPHVFVRRIRAPISVPVVADGLPRLPRLCRVRQSLRARGRPRRPADARLNIEWKRTTAVFGPNLTACTGLISSLRISKPRAKRRHRRMTKQDVYVESNTAQSLAAQASSRGKTLYSFTNEVLDVALRVLGQGETRTRSSPRGRRPGCRRTSRVRPSFRAA